MHPGDRVLTALSQQRAQNAPPQATSRPSLPAIVTSNLATASTSGTVHPHATLISQPAAEPAAQPAAQSSSQAPASATSTAAPHVGRNFAPKLPQGFLEAKDGVARLVFLTHGPRSRSQPLRRDNFTAAIAALCNDSSMKSILRRSNKHRDVVFYRWRHAVFNGQVDNFTWDTTLVKYGFHYIDREELDVMLGEEVTADVEAWSGVRSALLPLIPEIISSDASDAKHAKKASSAMSASSSGSVSGVRKSSAPAEEEPAAKRPRVGTPGVSRSTSATSLAPPQPASIQTPLLAPTPIVARSPLHADGPSQPFGSVAALEEAAVAASTLLAPPSVVSAHPSQLQEQASPLSTAPHFASAPPLPDVSANLSAPLPSLGTLDTERLLHLALILESERELVDRLLRLDGHACKMLSVLEQRRQVFLVQMNAERAAIARELDQKRMHVAALSQGILTSPSLSSSSPASGPRWQSAPAPDDRSPLPL